MHWMQAPDTWPVALIVPKLAQLMEVEFKKKNSTHSTQSFQFYSCDNKVMP